MELTAPLMLRVGRDGERLEIRLSSSDGHVASLDAVQVEEAIAALQNARAAMQPVPHWGDAFDTSRTLSGPGMRYSVRHEQDGASGVALAMLHPGIGWVAMHLDQTSAFHLAGLLAGAKLKFDA